MSEHIAAGALGKCLWCEKKDGVKLCDGCWAAVYCSDECQAEGWEQHKYLCYLFDPRGSGSRSHTDHGVGSEAGADAPAEQQAAVPGGRKHDDAPAAQEEIQTAASFPPGIIDAVVEHAGRTKRRNVGPAQAPKADDDDELVGELQMMHEIRTHIVPVLYERVMTVRGLTDRGKHTEDFRNLGASTLLLGAAPKTLVNVASFRARFAEYMQRSLFDWEVNTKTGAVEVPDGDPGEPARIAAIARGERAMPEDWEALVSDELDQTRINIAAEHLASVYREESSAASSTALGALLNPTSAAAAAAAAASGQTKRDKVEIIARVILDNVNKHTGSRYLYSPMNRVIYVLYVPKAKRTYAAKRAIAPGMTQEDIMHLHRKHLSLLVKPRSFAYSVTL